MGAEGKQKKDSEAAIIVPRHVREAFAVTLSAHCCSQRRKLSKCPRTCEKGSEASIPVTETPKNGYQFVLPPATCLPLLAIQFLRF